MSDGQCTFIFNISWTRYYVQDDMYNMSCTRWHVQDDMYNMSCTRLHAQDDMYNMSCTRLHVQDDMYIWDGSNGQSMKAYGTYVSTSTSLLFL